MLANRKLNKEIEAISWEIGYRLDNKETAKQLIQSLDKLGYSKREVKERLDNVRYFLRGCDKDLKGKSGEEATAQFHSMLKKSLSNKQLIGELTSARVLDVARIPLSKYATDEERRHYASVQSRDLDMSTVKSLFAAMERLGDSGYRVIDRRVLDLTAFLSRNDAFNDISGYFDTINKKTVEMFTDPEVIKTAMAIATNNEIRNVGSYKGNIAVGYLNMASRVKEKDILLSDGTIELTGIIIKRTLAKSDCLDFIKDKEDLEVLTQPNVISAANGLIDSGRGRDVKGFLESCLKDGEVVAFDNYQLNPSGKRRTIREIREIARRNFDTSNPKLERTEDIRRSLNIPIEKVKEFERVRETIEDGKRTEQAIAYLKGLEKKKELYAFAWYMKFYSDAEGNVRLNQMYEEL